MCQKKVIRLKNEPLITNEEVDKFLLRQVFNVKYIS